VIRKTGPPAFFLIATCFILQLPLMVQAVALLLTWILFLLCARRGRKRTSFLIVFIIGLTLVGSHVRLLGTGAYLRRSISTIDDFCRSISIHRIETDTDHSDIGFEDLRKRVEILMGPDVICAMTDSGGRLVAWTSGIIPAMLDSSEITRLFSARDKIYISHHCPIDNRFFHIALPLVFRPDSHVPDGNIAQSDIITNISIPRFVDTDLISLFIIGGFFLLLIEISATSSWLIAAFCAVTFRLMLRYCIPAHGIFGPMPFASFIPFLDSAGDVFLSASVLFFLGLSRPFTIGFIRSKGILSSVLFTAAVSFNYILIERVFLWLLDHMVIEDFSYETLILHPGFVAILVSFLLIIIILTRLPALFRRSWWMDGALSILAVLLILNNRTHTGSLIFLILGLSRLHGLRTMTRVGRWTGMVLWGIAFIIPLWNLEYDRMNVRRVEDLSHEIADPGLPWFRLLVKETIRGIDPQSDLHDIWAQSPLAEFPVMGEISRIDSSGILSDRFAFGYTSTDPPRYPLSFDSAEREVVRDVADNTIPPLPTVIVQSDPGPELSIIQICLLADIAAPLLAGTPSLSDGTHWPSDLLLADQGLISDIEIGTFAIGWSEEEHGRGKTFGFQREFADGPHLLTVQMDYHGYGNSILALLAVFGFVAIVAQSSLGIWQIWKTPSPRVLFYRYRDRLLPFLLVIAAPPLVAILLLGPWAERRVLNEQTDKRLRLRLDELSSRFRTEVIEHAMVVSRHSIDTPLDTMAHWSGETSALFDSTGICIDGDARQASILSPAIVRSVFRTGRPLMIIPPDIDVVAAVVPVGYEGILAVFQPLHIMLSRLSTAMPDVSMAFWKNGKRVSASIKPPCKEIVKFITFSPPRFRTAQSLQTRHELDRWLIRSVSDDVRDNAIHLGIRRELTGRVSKLESTVHMWGLGILLPVIVGIVFLSSWAAGLVSKPITEMTVRARRIEDDELDVVWPTPTGELGQLSYALSSMTKRLIESRMVADQRRTYLSAVLSRITSAVMVVRRDGTIELTNPPADKLLETSVILGPDDSMTLLHGPLGDAVSSVFVRGVSTTQTIVIDSDTHPRQWQVGVAPLTHGTSSLMNAVVILEEITELAERERLVAWASFAREMAHEIKNPLTPMKLAAQHLRKARSEKRPDFDSVLTKATEMIERQTNRIEQIVREFSSFTKATGKEFVPLDLCTIVRECTEDFRYAAPQDVILTAECPEGEVIISGDREAVRKILTNLIDNAIRAVGTAGKITITVETGGDMAVLICVDNGVGIPPEIKSRIFEPGVSSRPGGTGLGLSICRSLVAAHGGRIEIIDALSGGTGIRIEIPLNTTKVM